MKFDLPKPISMPEAKPISLHKEKDYFYTKNDWRDRDYRPKPKPIYWDPREMNRLDWIQLSPGPSFLKF